MKIKIEPVTLTMLSIDHTSETALLKSHLPRARKIANASNLLNLLGQHYGTCRSVMTYDPALVMSCADRWLDCNQARVEVHPHPCFRYNADARPLLDSTVGILTVEDTHSLNTDTNSRVSYRRILLYIPLDPTNEVGVYCSAESGTFPDRAVPTLIYRVEIQTA